MSAIPEKLEVIRNIEEKHLQEIEPWLSDKKNTSICGIYNHWDFIIEKQRKNKMMCFLIENSIVGFITWVYDFDMPYQMIEYLVINEKFQRKGYGSLFTERCFNYFIQQGIKAIILSSIAEQSNAFWYKMGFNQYPKEYNNHPYFYKFIVNNQKESIYNTNNEIIELWATEYWNENMPPTYIFDVEYQPNSNILKTPIIMLCDDNWHIRWRIKNKIYKDTKIRRFYKNARIDYAEILIIDKLENKP